MNIKKILLIATILFLGVVAEFWVLDIFCADVYLKKGRVLLEEGRVEDSLVYFDRAIEKNDEESFYYRNRAQVYLTLASIEINNESVYALKKLALSDLEYAYNLNPNNLRVIRNSIPLYYYLAGDDFDLYTRNFYSMVKKKYSRDVGAISDVAKYEKKLGWDNEYFESIAMIYKLRPDLLNWYLVD